MCCFCCCCGSKDGDGSGGMHKEDRRSCTDLCALFFFLAFCAGLGAVTVYGVQAGDSYKIIYGTDSFGNTCGRDNEPLFLLSNNSAQLPLSGRNMTNKRYLFPLNASTPISTLWVCAEKCPDVGISTIQDAQQHDLCIERESQTTTSSQPSTSDRWCPSLPVRPSVPLLYRCVPGDILSFGWEMASQLVSAIKEIDWVRSVTDSLWQSSHRILESLLLAIVLSVAMVFLLRFIAPIAVYAVYLLVILVFIGISGGLWYTWWSLHGVTRFGGTTAMDFTPTSGVPTTDPAPIRTTRLAEYIVGADGSKTVLTNNFANDSVYIRQILEKPTVSEGAILGLALGASVISVVTMIFTWCLLPRGKLIIDLFKQAGQALSSMPFLLLQPIFTAAAVIIITLYSLVSALLVHSAAQPVSRVMHDKSDLVAVAYNTTDLQRYLLCYQFVGFVWLLEYAFAYQRMLVAGSVATWYFDKSNSSPVCSSRWTICRYHLGSLALGSFIITLVRVPRFVLMYIYAKLQATENVVVKKILCCCIGCLGCIEKCLNYINFNAYTVIAYTGQSFCPAAKTAVNVLLDNAVHVATINSIGDFVLFLAKVAVAAVSATICFLLVKDDHTLNLWWPPVVLVAIIGYIVSNCFLSVYEMVIDALFLCIAEDTSLEREGASPRRNPEMMEYMERTLTLERSMSHPSKTNNRRRKEKPNRMDETVAFEMNGY